MCALLQDLALTATSAPGLGGLAPCHICTETGLTPSPHLHRDWAHPAHIFAGTGLACSYFNPPTLHHPTPPFVLLGQSTELRVSVFGLERTGDPIRCRFQASRAGAGLATAHICAGTGLAPAHICAGTGLARESTRCRCRFLLC